MVAHNICFHGEVKRILIKIPAYLELCEGAILESRSNWFSA